MLRLILIISLVIAIIFSIVIGLVFWMMINRYRQKVLKSNFNASYENALNDPKNGQLLIQLKKQVKSPLEDLQLIYAINTIIRNQYQTSCVSQFVGGYEEQNLIAMAKQKIICDNYDFLLINSDDQIIEKLPKKLEKLNQKGMIMICNVKKKRQLKEALYDLCQNKQCRFSYEKVGKGIILIAK